MSRRALAALALAAFALAACGGGDDAESAATQPTASDATLSEASPTENADGADSALCDLLPEADITDITGFAVTLVQPHNGPGPLHFCTIYIDVPNCDMNCALSLEDLDIVDPNSYNDATSYRDSLLSANPDANPTFKEAIAGAESWLATMTAGAIPGLKLAYFQVGDRAYDLTSPRIEGGAVTEDQMAQLVQAVIANAR